MSRPTIGVIGVLCLLALVMAPWGAGAQEPPKADDAGDSTAKSKAKTIEISPGPFQVHVSASGVFEATEVAEVSLAPVAWSAFQVVSAVEEGTQVAEGDVLVTFDSRKIDEEIQDLQAGKKLADLGLELAEKELGFFQQTQPLDMESAERANRIASEDLKHFTEVDRALSERSAEESLKGSRYRLEYAQEELDQLKQMYEEDDITEETEEIILKRAQRSVESSKFWLERSEVATRQTLEVELPRRAESLEAQARRQAILLAKTEATFPMEMAKKELDLEKMAYDRKKAEERYGKLLADRGLMEVKAPAAGIVYYGRAERGKWVGGDAVAKQLRPGGNVPPHQVFITIVQPRPVTVRVELPEKDLRYLAEGIAGKVIPTAYPDRKLPCTLKRITPIPVRAGTFDATVEVEMGEGTDALLPGMACTVKLVAYEQAEALTVPGSAVFHDDLDDDKTYVYQVDGDGEPKKQPVVLGKHGEDKVEVVEGLSAGDEILPKKPD